MMFLDPYFHQQAEHIAISEEQGSAFAKQIADDFNPIHNVGNRRFCVPGDLLFSIALSKYGVFEQMSFAFVGMVSGGMPLSFPTQAGNEASVKNHQGKTVMEMSFNGKASKDNTFSEALTRQYVAFSGHNFPHILVPLMATKDVMINPDRPLVMYESMSLQFHALDFTAPQLSLLNSSLSVNGKRGNVRLDFEITSGGRTVGEGYKRLTIGGLKPYDKARMDEAIEDFMEKKALGIALDN